MSGEDPTALREQPTTALPIDGARAGGGGELSPAALARVAAAVGQQQHPAMPAQLGRYRLVELIGEGGMGAVYKAAQDHPIRRTVAVKLIKLGMSTRDVLSRFDSERQALAWMDHPNVAKVLDAGSDPLSGQPYFVMEHVTGESITNYCDRHQLTVRQRLELFVQVCQGVAHAHQKMIVHRDLKPANILVSSTNGPASAQVKVIDFGVAKALVSGGLANQTACTKSGQLLGTPEYMSPEQARSDEAQDIDTRSDIYSLGVVLYELLTGLLPFDAKALRGSGPDGLERTLREIDPPSPSTRLSSLDHAEARQIAERRQTRLDELSRQLKGELEWIPLKAMRKERSHRYATASELASDIENYLQNRPLIAGPESRRYRAAKFVKRNKVALAIAAAFALLLGGGTAIYLRGVRAEQAKTLAALAQAQSANQTAQAVSDFLTDDVLGKAGPDNLRDDLVQQKIVKVMLEPAAANVEQRFKDRPLTAAAIHRTLAVVYNQLGRPDLGLPHAQAALQHRRRILGEDHADTILSVSDLAIALRMLGRLREAEPLLKQSLEQHRRLLGEDHEDTIGAMENYAGALHELGHDSEAEPLFKEVLTRLRRLAGEDNPQTILALHNYAAILLELRRYGEAEPLLLEALQRNGRTLGDDHPNTIHSLNNYAEVLARLKRFDDAAAMHKEAMERRRHVLGDDHPDTINSRFNYADTLKSLGRLEEAAALYKTALEQAHRTLGPDHPLTLMITYDTAALTLSMRGAAEAEPLFAALYESAARSQIDPARAARYMSYHGTTLVALARYQEAEPRLREAYGRLNETGQQGSERAREVVASLGDVCEHTNRHDEAERWRTELAKLRAATQPATDRHP